MKRGIVLFLFVGLFSVANYSAANGRELERLLKLLDTTVANKDFYFAKKQMQIDSLKALFSLAPSVERKFGLAQELCFGYSSFVKDSSLIYASAMNDLSQRLASPERVVQAKIDHIGVLCTMGYFKEAWDIVEEVNTLPLTDELVREFYLAQITYYNHLADFSPNSSEKERNSLLAQQFRDSIENCSNLASNIRTFLQSATFLHHRQYEAAIVVLDSIMNGYPLYSRDAGIVAYSIAEAYDKLNRQEDALRYYVISSISDLRNGVREYRSLRRVARILFQQNEISRAYKYMRCSLEDAINSNAHLNSIDALDMFLMIDKTFYEQEKKNAEIISLLLIALVGLCSLLLFILLKLRNQRRITEEANRNLKIHLEEIQNYNVQLSENSLIKEQYIGLYMQQYSSYLNKFSLLQKKALILAKKGDSDALMDFLQSSFNHDNEMAEFHYNFDVAVVSLFPNFVSEFNELLLPDLTVAVDKGKILTPELRIFALIRLGISDSVKISYFLQYSISTIYNYRTKMRNRAKGNRDEFEQKVMLIGRANS